MPQQEQTERLLQEGAAQLGLALTVQQQRQLLDYVALLHKWNRVYNLTSVRDPLEMLRLHVLDCLAVVQPFRQVMDELVRQGLPAQALDVGAGGGLPSVVLAIGCPDVSIHCVDAVAKKMAFVRQAAGALSLRNLQAIHARVESLEQRYAVITSRAFASLADFTALTHSLLMPQGVWMAMKGKYPAEEVGQLPKSVEVFHVEPLQVPGLDAQRCIVWMRSGTALQSEK